MVLVGFAILVGGLIGAAVLPIGGVPITLSTSGGALIAGIFVGWLRTVKPQIGNVPQATLWFMNSVGLNVFIAIVGISSGPTFIAGLKQAGFGIFFWGLFATGVPMLLAPLDRKVHLSLRPGDQPRLLRRRAHLDGLGCDGWRGRQERCADARLHGPLCGQQHAADAVGPGDRAADQVKLAEVAAVPE